MKPLRTRPRCVYTGKIRYRDWIAAQLAVERLRAAPYYDWPNDATFRPYRCPECHGWHLGHSAEELA